MSGLTANPAFDAYALTTLVLSLNLLSLWVFSGARRAHGGVAINAEDAARYSVPLSPMDPPEVARWLRAHRNAEATIYPFLVVGLVYVLAGGGVSLAAAIFSIFVASRIAHSIVYVRGLQPWRTVAFALSLMAILVLIFATLSVLVSHWGR